MKPLPSIFSADPPLVSFFPCSDATISAVSDSHKREETNPSIPCWRKTLSSKIYCGCWRIDRLPNNPPQLVRRHIHTLLMRVSRRPSSWSCGTETGGSYKPFAREGNESEGEVLAVRVGELATREVVANGGWAGRGLRRRWEERLNFFHFGLMGRSQRQHQMKGRYVGLVGVGDRGGDFEMSRDRRVQERRLSALVGEVRTEYDMISIC